jgi:hypothetical protein
MKKYLRIEYLVTLYLLALSACDNVSCDLCDQNAAPNTPYSCPNDGPPGSPLARCTSDNACDLSDFTCISITCISCGTVGRVCCDSSGSTGCSPSLSCVTGDSDYATCEDCGAIGKSCCTGTSDPCHSGATCDLTTHVCEIDPNQGEGPLHFVSLLTPHRCASEPHYFNVGPNQTVTSAAQAVLAMANMGLPPAQQYTLGPIGTTPTAYHVCGYNGFNSIDKIDLNAFSHADLAECELEHGPVGENWGWQGPPPQYTCPAWPNQNPPNP